MILSKQIVETLNNSKELALQLNVDNRLNLLKEDLGNVTERAIDSAAKYIIKAMPVPDAVKDILHDVKDALKTRDLKKILATAVKSTVREGFELIGLNANTIKSIMELKEVAVKGGYIMAIKNGIEIVANNYLKSNIVGEYVYNFFDKLKNYIMNNTFMKKINSLLEKMMSKKTTYMDVCNKWYEAYDNMDLTEINNIAQKLSDNRYILNRYEDCKKENSIIQNMTAMVNSKKASLSSMQQKLCEAM